MLRWRMACFVVPLGFLSLTAAARGDASVDAGAVLARDACSACHQVSPAQKRPPPVFDPDEQTGKRAPSFMAIARSKRTDAASLRRFITRPHYPMREQSFDKGDLDSLVAYILSLRPAP